MQRVLAGIIEALPITLMWNFNFPPNFKLGDFDPNEFHPLEKSAKVVFASGVELIVDITNEPRFFAMNKHEMAQYLASRIVGRND